MLIMPGQIYKMSDQKKGFERTLVLLKKNYSRFVDLDELLMSLRNTFTMLSKFFASWCRVVTLEKIAKSAAS